MKDFTATIETSGDRSVGIPGEQIEVRWCGARTVDDTGIDREFLRLRLIHCFIRLLDGKPGVRFSDECPDCGKVLNDGRCLNQQCWTNQPKENQP
jgi:hypothetical protein